MNPRELELVEAFLRTPHGAWWRELGNAPFAPMPKLEQLVGRERAGWLVWLYGSADKALWSLARMKAWLAMFAAPADVRKLLEQAAAPPAAERRA